MAALTIAGMMALAALVSVASAESSVEAAIRSKQDLRGRIEDLHELRRVRRIGIHQQIKFHQNRLQNSAGRGSVGNGRGYGEWRKRQVKAIKKLRKREHKLVVSLDKRVSALRNRRAELADWIESQPLQRCPVDGEVSFGESFGIVHHHEDYTHIHQGVDMTAATGTPIVAPFDGTAVADPSGEGGEGVLVYGVNGYVYNAHLSAYGKLGEVQSGDIIGYVGETGNASGPHNHFEWHPGDGDAVDPYDLLVEVC